jgi:hypothetical protein
VAKSQFSGKVREEAERDIQVRSAWPLQVPVWSDRRAELGVVQLQQENRLTKRNWFPYVRVNQT